MAEWTHLLMLVASDIWAAYVFHDALDSNGNRLHLRLSACLGCLFWRFQQAQWECIADSSRTRISSELVYAVLVV